MHLVAILAFQLFKHKEKNSKAKVCGINKIEGTMLFNCKEEICN